LRRTAGDAALRSRIVDTHNRKLSERQLRLWQVLLDIPQDSVSTWLAQPGGAASYRRTARAPAEVHHTSTYCISAEGHVLPALTWFDDADRDPEPVLQSAETWDGVKATLRAWVKQAARPAP
jgi:hypothetical protein